MVVGPFGDEKLRKHQRYPSQVYVTIIERSEQMIFAKISVTPILAVESHYHGEAECLGHAEVAGYENVEPNLI